MLNMYFYFLQFLLSIYIIPHLEIFFNSPFRQILISVFVKNLQKGVAALMLYNSRKTLGYVQT